MFTKLYTENTEEKITIYDLSGNSTDITIFVTDIGSETGEETKPGEDGKPGDSEKRRLRIRKRQMVKIRPQICILVSLVA